MNILYLSYWEAADGLSRATVIPHLHILKEIAHIDKIIYCSIERSEKQVDEEQLGESIMHKPLYSGKSYIHKILDFSVLPRRLARLVREHSIDMMVCRGSPSGSLGYLVNSLQGTPYIVESFEPHALYMLESGVWNKHGLRYRFQRKWEEAQLRTAYRILTASQNYREYLIRSGVPEQKVLAVPCAVDAQKFSFDVSRRIAMRSGLGFQDSSIVGVYVGKFGGLYYDHEAFQIFSEAFQHIRDFKLIILTPDPPGSIRQKLEQVGIPVSSYFLSYASHNSVPDYLSAADLAFALYKPSPSKRFLSPIKIAEYWANGLPVLLTEGIGDDSEIIRTEGGGATFSLSETGSVTKSLKYLETLIRENGRERLSASISTLALKYRNFNHVGEVYDRVLYAWDCN